jgi:hypothetical protein
MRGGLEGIEAVVMLRSGRLSDWPEIASPAFQFLLSAGGDFYAPRTEGSLDPRDYRSQAELD